MKFTTEKGINQKSGLKTKVNQENEDSEIPGDIGEDHKGWSSRQSD